MARPVENAGVQPWPDHFVCDDGINRSLAKYNPEQWLDHPDVQQGGDGGLVFTSHRIRAARSLGRDPVAIISAMAGRPARRQLFGR